jgi:hypothetical protein
VALITAAALEEWYVDVVMRALQTIEHITIEQDLHILAEDMRKECEGGRLLFSLQNGSWSNDAGKVLSGAKRLRHLIHHNHSNQLSDLQVLFAHGLAQEFAELYQKTVIIQKINGSYTRSHNVGIWKCCWKFHWKYH